MKKSQRISLGLALVAAGAAVAVRARSRTRTIDFAGKTVVIFGGSRGLGLVIARELAYQDARLVLVARDRDELGRASEDIESRGGSVSTVECDVRDRARVEDTIERIVAQYGVLDVLINDAGIIQVGPLDNMVPEDFADAMATHFWGPLFTILAALPHMRRAGAKRIVNISSIGGKIAVPHMLPYSASKFALTGLSEGLHAELARDGFRVTTVCPGLMRTGSTYNAQFKGQHGLEFAWFHLADSIPGLSTSAERAAHQVIEACRHGDAELIITVPARLAVLLNAVAPGVTATMMAMTNVMLPKAADGDGFETRSGWQSASRDFPSSLTKLSDRATIDNNEIPDPTRG